MEQDLSPLGDRLGQLSLSGDLPFRRERRRDRSVENRKPRGRFFIVKTAGRPRPGGFQDKVSFTIDPGRRWHQEARNRKLHRAGKVITSLPLGGPRVPSFYLSLSLPVSPSSSPRDDAGSSILLTAEVHLGCINGTRRCKCLTVLWRDRLINRCTDSPGAFPIS